MAGFAPEVLAKLKGMGLFAPMGIGGEKFFVNGATGSNTLNNGKSFLSPFKTIRHALDQCEDERGDYIFCFECRQQETFPIDVDKVSVHIIGIAGPNGQWQRMIGAAAPDESAIFNFPVSKGHNAEIANFSLGGGPANACIELQGENEMVHIHHCSFGHLWTDVASQDGIKYLAGAVHHGGVVEDCWFYGNALGAGKLTRCGIILENGWLSHATFRNNYFFKIPGKDIGGNVVGGAICGNGWLDQVAIIHNKINVADGETCHGNGIYLGDGCIGCLVANNEANDGLAASTNNPFVDAADADNNAWCSNQWCITLDMPEPAPA